MLWKCYNQYASKFGKLSNGHRTGKGQFSFQSQRKAMPKNLQTTAQLQSSHRLTRSVQFSSVAQLCLTLREPKDCSIPGLPVNHQFSDFTQTHESVMPSNHLILYRPFLLPPSICPRIRVFSNESAIHIRWPKYWNFSFNISPTKEYSGLISFRINSLDLLAVKGLSRVFSNTTVQNHQFFSAQFSLYSNSHSHT